MLVQGNSIIIWNKLQCIFHKKLAHECVKTAQLFCERCTVALVGKKFSGGNSYLLLELFAEGVAVTVAQNCGGLLNGESLI